MTGNTGILPYPPRDPVAAALPPARIAQAGATSGQVLKWNGTAWAPGADNSGANTFLQLTDTPASYAGHASKVLRVNAAETALEFVSGGGGGASTFLDLTDTPSSYTGHATKLLRVNANANGVEFVDDVFIRRGDWYWTPSAWTNSSIGGAGGTGANSAIPIFQNNVPAGAAAHGSAWWLLETGTTASGWATVMAASANDQVGSQFREGPGKFFETYVYLGTLFDSENDYTVVFGYGEPHNGISPTGRGCHIHVNASTGTWRCRTRTDAGSTTETDSNITAQGNTVYRLRMTFVTTTSVAFHINGTHIATHTTNYDGVGRHTFGVRILKSTGTASRVCAVLYFWSGVR